MIEWWLSLDWGWQVLSIYLVGVSFVASYIWCRDPAFEDSDMFTAAGWPVVAFMGMFLIPAIPCILFKRIRKYKRLKISDALLISELEEENVRLKTQLKRKKKRGKK